MNNNEEDKLSNSIIELYNEIKKQGAKTNLALGELRLSYMKLDESVNSMRHDINAMRTDWNGKIDSLNSGFSGMRYDFNKYAQSNNALLKNHEARLVRLEEKDGRGAANMVSEPRAVYKKAKKKK